MVWSMGCDGPAGVRGMNASDSKHLYWLPLPCSDSTLGLSLVCLSQPALCLNSAALALVLSCSSKHERPVWTFGMSRGASCGGAVARRDQSRF